MWIVRISICVRTSWDKGRDRLPRMGLSGYCCRLGLLLQVTPLFTGPLDPLLQHSFARYEFAGAKDAR